MDHPILQPDQMALLIKGLAIDDNPQQQEYCLSILLNLAAEGEPPPPLSPLRMRSGVEEDD